MWKYVLKRILMMIPVLLGISFVIFALMDLNPADPARLILGEFADQAAVDQLRDEMGLNDNFFVRYFRTIFEYLQGDFGKSYIFRNSVFESIVPRIPSTIILALGATLLMVIVGVPIGIISAVKQYSAVDMISMTGALLLTSMPAFWLGLMLLLAFSLNLKWFPSNGADSFRHFVLPWITLAASMMASLLRMTRSSMLEVIKQDYVRTARAKGANEKSVIFKHALRNALMPVITVIGLNFGSLLGGSFVIENVFGLPGIGMMIISSVRGMDTPLVMASVLFVALFAGIVNLIVDLLYAFVNPQIKSQYANSKKASR